MATTSCITQHGGAAMTGNAIKSIATHACYTKATGLNHQKAMRGALLNQHTVGPSRGTIPLGATMHHGFGDPTVKAQQPRPFTGQRLFFFAPVLRGARVPFWCAVWGHPRGCAGSLTRFANPTRSAAHIWRCGAVLKLSSRSQHG